MVRQHEEHTRAILEPYGGVLVKNLGDNFMVGFISQPMLLRPVSNSSSHDWSLIPEP